MILKFFLSIAFLLKSINCADFGSLTIESKFKIPSESPISSSCAIDQNTFAILDKKGNFYIYDLQKEQILQNSKLFSPNSFIRCTEQSGVIYGLNSEKNQIYEIKNITSHYNLTKTYKLTHEEALCFGLIDDENIIIATNKGNFIILESMSVISKIHTKIEANFSKKCFFRSLGNGNEFLFSTDDNTEEKTKNIIFLSYGDKLNSLTEDLLLQNKFFSDITPIAAEKVFAVIDYSENSLEIYDFGGNLKQNISLPFQSTSNSMIRKWTFPDKSHFLILSNADKLYIFDYKNLEIKEIFETENKISFELPSRQENPNNCLIQVGTKSGSLYLVNMNTIMNLQSNSLLQDSIATSSIFVYLIAILIVVGCCGFCCVLNRKRRKKRYIKRIANPQNQAQNPQNQAQNQQIYANNQQNSNNNQDVAPTVCCCCFPMGCGGCGGLFFVGAGGCGGGCGAVFGGCSPGGCGGGGCGGGGGGCGGGGGGCGGGGGGGCGGGGCGGGGCGGGGCGGS